MTLPQVLLAAVFGVLAAPLVVAVLIFYGAGLFVLFAGHLALIVVDTVWSGR